jgi:peptide/nickel transport system permease protein
VSEGGDLQAADIAAVTIGPRSGFPRLTRTRFRFRGQIALTFGLVLLAVIAICSLAAPLIAPSALNHQDINVALLKPGSPGHVLGTDQFGRDTLTRLLYAGRQDLVLAFAATIVPVCFGTLVGVVSGYAGGWVDAVIMRITDVIFAFPFLVLVLTVVAIFGPGMANLLFAIWAVGWVSYARLVRAEVLALRNREYVLAAEALGYSRPRIVLLHILPNVASGALVYGAIDTVNNLNIGAALGFLGLGVQPPTPEWGSMIAAAQNYLTTDWWLAALPGACIVLLGLSCTIIGDVLADRLRGGR